MPQSLARVTLHIIFSTKHRTPWLKDAGIRDELYRYMATVLKGIECPAILINGVQDHIHIVCNLSRKCAIKDLIEEAKTETSKWIKTKGPTYAKFHWQAGYGVFSVSQSKLEDVRTYVANQEEHHKKRTFQDEFRLICTKHGIEIDERYVWD